MPYIYVQELQAFNMFNLLQKKVGCMNENVFTGSKAGLHVTFKMLTWGSNKPLCWTKLKYAFQKGKNESLNSTEIP